MDRYLSAATSLCLGAALVFAPLAFGAAEPWAYAVLAVIAYAALATAIVRCALAGRLRSLLTPILIPLVLALVLVCVQYVRWPVGLLESVSPRAAAAHRDAAAAVSGSGAHAAVRTASPSVYRHGTRGALILLSTYVALFVAACDYVRSREKASRLAAVILGIGFCVSLFGIAQSLSGTRKIYWLRELSHGGALFGPFVSRNQFATYAGVCFFMGLALLMGRGARAAGSLRNWREGISRAYSRRAHQNFLAAFATALIGAAVFWSLSRAGIVSMMLALAGVVTVMALASGGGRRRPLYAAAIVMTMLGWVTYLGWEPIMSRFDRLQDAARDPMATWRWIMCGDSLRMGLDFPLLGTGAGTFVSAYPVYRTLPTRALSVSPHDEYFHVFAEAGFPGVILLLCVMGIFYVAVARALKARRNPYVRGFLAGGLGAPVLVTLHSIVDFPMRSPAVAATVSVAVAVLWQMARMPSERAPEGAPNGGPRGNPVPIDIPPAGSEPNGPGGNPLPSGKKPRHGAKPRRQQTDRNALIGSLDRGLAALVLVGIGWAVAANAALDPLRGQLDAMLIERTQERVARGAGPTGILAFVEASERKIARHSAGDAELQASLAELAADASQADPDPAERLRLADRSLGLLARATAAEPLSAEHAYWTAVHYLRYQRPDLAWVQAERACALRPNDPWVRAYLADAFRAYAGPEFARPLIERAEALAEERSIDQAVSLITAVRKRIEEEAKEQS